MNELDDTNTSFIDNLIEDPKVKIGLYVVAALAGIYLLGHVFKIFAHTAEGYNKMTNAFKNGGTITSGQGI